MHSDAILTLSIQTAIIRLVNWLLTTKSKVSVNGGKLLKNFMLIEFN